uniref:Pyrin domain-containing protein n=1 Tax=Stegastes partitus TaxID=144197 RepID=A0A3B4Z121_9TELE
LGISEELLFATLEELLADQLKTFQWFLASNVLEGFDHIPRARIEDVDRTSTVDLLVNTYGYDGAVTVTVRLKKMVSRFKLIYLCVNLIFK